MHTSIHKKRNKSVATDLEQPKKRTKVVKKTVIFDWEQVKVTCEIKNVVLLKMDIGIEHVNQKLMSLLTSLQKMINASLFPSDLMLSMEGDVIQVFCQSDVDLFTPINAWVQKKCDKQNKNVVTITFSSDEIILLQKNEIRKFKEHLSTRLKNYKEGIYQPHVRVLWLNAQQEGQFVLIVNRNKDFFEAENAFFDFVKRELLAYYKIISNNSNDNSLPPSLEAAIQRVVATDERKSVIDKTITILSWDDITVTMRCHDPATFMDTLKKRKSQYKKGKYHSLESSWKKSENTVVISRGDMFSLKKKLLVVVVDELITRRDIVDKDGRKILRSKEKNKTASDQVFLSELIAEGTTTLVKEPIINWEKVQREYKFLKNKEVAVIMSEEYSVKELHEALKEMEHQGLVEIHEDGNDWLRIHLNGIDANLQELIENFIAANVIANEANFCVDPKEADEFITEHQEDFQKLLHDSNIFNSNFSLMFFKPCSPNTPLNIEELNIDDMCHVPSPTSPER
ncbi:MAG: hypothetical protein EPO11_03405 [Gammaproteobacteria bacterium]|nr:MAG: hypothetical protein EPO11_03405 [Gammaproteobacteria bacterium]